MVDIMKNITVRDLGNDMRMVKHTNGSYIIYNSTTNQIERQGFVNPDSNNPELQHQKAAIQRNNSYALEMYALVNKCAGKSSTYDNIQNMAEVNEYPQRQYQKASQQRSDNENAIQMYELVKTISDFCG